MASTGGGDQRDGSEESDGAESPTGGTRVRRAVGVLALLAVPVLLAAVPLVPAAALLGPPARRVAGPGVLGGLSPPSSSDSAAPRSSVRSWSTAGSPGSPRPN